MWWAVPTLLFSNFTGNKGDGVQIDAANSTISINNSKFTNNGDDGFDIDASGTGNTVNVANSEFTNNSDDGFDILGTNN
ncbi:MULTISPECIES: right-handed parallel beta-helix repeat-containing protein [unclassified Chamaesiphon]|uniref:right-handed parallel beta-helix repeat-containing protein n=1 Tax=unclassified Chamaesiphon TaxID=2620921 RepID=UPI00286B8D54|nr:MULTISPECIES: right-handed parallel beta-helix repeat-containing protein [unclassified Chamaesiphon]